VNFLVVLIELFSVGVMAEALRAKIDRKLAISLQCGQSGPKFQVEGVTPQTIIFALIVRPTLSPTVFIQSNFVAYFLQAKCNFRRKREFCVFRSNVR